MAALELLVADRLLRAISPRHETNMTHTYNLNLKRRRYLSVNPEEYIED